MRAAAGRRSLVSAPLYPATAGRSFRIHRCMWGVKVMSKAEKQSLRYSDYYWCMSLKDFTEWIEADDDQEPATSYSDRP